MTYSTTPTKQKRLRAVEDALRAVGEARVTLDGAGIMEYNPDDTIYKASVALSNLLDVKYAEIYAEPDWNDGTKPEWRTHGVVVVAQPGNTRFYARDDDFEVEGEHLVWLDGYKLHKDSTRGMWKRLA